VRCAVPVALAGVVVSLAATARAEEAAEQIPIAAIRLKVALIEDPDFPPLDDNLIGRALESAAETFSARFQVERPTFQLAARFSVDDFMKRFAKPDTPECSPLYAATYRGGGKNELLPLKDRAVKFFERWNLDSLQTFIEPEHRANVRSYGDLHEHYMRRYLATVAKLSEMQTPRGTPLIQLGGVHWRSHAAWSCASGQQRDFDVLITNTFILADLLTEPHPHTVFGKAKVGGIAGPNPHRTALGGQALVASTFAIDTSIEFLSELGGKPIGIKERSEILGAYLIAHEIAHAIFGIPDVFDHPSECVMTSRPGETYREGLEVLKAHEGPCPRCRPYVQARSALDKGRGLLEQGDAAGALSALSLASKLTPKQLHGGYKRRMAEISVLVSEAYARQGNDARAKSFAENAVSLDPRFDLAQKQLARFTVQAPQLATSRRRIPETSTSTRGEKRAR
jgi:hypothetical protein